MQSVERGLKCGEGVWRGCRGWGVEGVLKGVGSGCRERWCRGVQRSGAGKRGEDCGVGREEKSST